MSKYRIGYWCSHDHYELYGDEDYDGSCGSKGIPVLLDLEPGDVMGQDIPVGEWVDDDA